MAQCLIWNTAYIAGRSKIYTDKFGAAMIVAGAGG